MKPAALAIFGAVALGLHRDETAEANNPRFDQQTKVRVVRYGRRADEIRIWQRLVSDADQCLGGIRERNVYRHYRRVQRDRDGIRHAGTATVHG